MSLAARAVPAAAAISRNPRGLAHNSAAGRSVPFLYFFSSPVQRTKRTLLRCRRLALGLLIFVLPRSPSSPPRPSPFSGFVNKKRQAHAPFRLYYAGRMVCPPHGHALSFTFRAPISCFALLSLSPIHPAFREPFPPSLHRASASSPGLRNGGVHWKRISSEPGRKARLRRKTRGGARIKGRWRGASILRARTRLS